jgi:hypothetical protein
VRHYINLRHTEPRLQRLLRDFAWQRVDRVFGEKLCRGATCTADQFAPPTAGLATSYGRA